MPDATLPPRTRFVGRERELAEAAALIGRHPLVTLTGSGGCGKTRLAAELVRTLDGEVCWVELAPVRGDAVGPAVAAALGSRDLAGDALVAGLSSSAILLVLDNCEHVLDASAALVQTLLERCPKVRVLATSREPLRLPGEVAWRVPSLDPDGEAVRLFEDRARLARPGYTIEGREDVVAGICRRLDGIPLAIELAAARVKVLSVEQIAARLDDRFRLLTGASRSRTLEATLDWSYERLSEPQRTLLARLSVFPSTCTLDAVTSVCTEDADELETLELLSGLADRSLVTAEDAGGEARYGMLETVRSYAAGKLGDDAEPVHARLYAWCVALAERAEGELSGPAQRMWLERLDREHDTFRACLDRSGEPRLAGALWRFWHARGYFTEGRARLERALEPSGGAPPVSRAKALNGAGVLAWAQGDYDHAAVRYEEALRSARELQDRRLIAATLNNLGGVLLHRGELGRADDSYRESLAIFTEMGDEPNASQAMLNLGAIAHAQGDLDEADRLWRDASDGFRRAGMDELSAHALNNLAHLAFARGAHDDASRLWGEALGTFRSLGNAQPTANMLTNLGAVASARGETEHAHQLFAEAVTAFLELGDRLGVATAIESLGRTAAALDDHERAAKVLGAADALREDIGAPRTAAEEEAHAAVVERLLSGLGETRFAAAWAAGAHADLETAARWALHRPAVAAPAAEVPVAFAEDDGAWTVTYRGRTSRVNDTKGVRYLVTLTRRPREEIHALELAGDVRDAGPAEQERARVNVTRAIGSAIARIRTHDRTLASYLEATVKTGVRCSYVPERRGTAVREAGSAGSSTDRL